MLLNRNSHVESQGTRGNRVTHTHTVGHAFCFGFPRSIRYLEGSPSRHPPHRTVPNPLEDGSVTCSERCHLPGCLVRCHHHSSNAHSRGSQEGSVARIATSRQLPRIKLIILQNESLSYMQPSCGSKSRGVGFGTRSAQEVPHGSFRSPLRSNPFKKEPLFSNPVAQDVTGAGLRLAWMAE